MLDGYFDKGRKVAKLWVSYKSKERTKVHLYDSVSDKAIRDGRFDIYTFGQGGDWR